MQQREPLRYAEYASEHNGVASWSEATDKGLSLMTLEEEFPMIKLQGEERNMLARVRAEAAIHFTPYTRVCFLMCG